MVWKSIIRACAMVVKRRSAAPTRAAQRRSLSESGRPLRARREASTAARHGYRQSAMLDIQHGPDGSNREQSAASRDPVPAARPDDSEKAKGFGLGRP